VSTKRKGKQDGQMWPQMIAANRQGINKTLREIEGGEVDTDGFMKLNNFCQFALALMEIAGESAWKQAKRRAEWACYAAEAQEKANGTGSE
jgi:hypothetical protein